MVGEFYVLKNHAAQALGIDPDALDLPRCAYGFSGDALWIDPRFIEIRRQREACQLAAHRYESCLHKPRTEEQKEATLSKTRQRRYARKKMQRRAKSAKRAAAATVAATAAHFSVTAYALAHGMIPYNLRQKLRDAGHRAPYSRADVERVLPPV